MSGIVVAVRHLAFEDLGCFAPVLEAAGHDIRYLDAGVDDLAPIDADDTRLTVILGGPIGAYEDDRYPFLQDELELVRRRLSKRRPTLGICLGAQLMARALGATVAPGPRAEIGFAPIVLTDAGAASPLAAFEGAPVLHWHGDVFGLPEGAERLASTEACHSQAFSLGPNILATQFHPEAGDAGFERWLIGHTHELSSRGESVERLRADHARLAPTLSSNATTCLEAWLAQLEA